MTYTTFRQKKDNRKRNIILAVLLGVTGILVAVGVSVAMSGNPGEITEAPVRKVTQPAKDQLYDGKHIQFTYKGMYHVSRPNNTGEDLELATLTANTNYEKHLAVAVSPLPGSKLENNSSYNLRKNTPETYKSRIVTIDGGMAIIYVKDTSEQTAFIQQGDKVVVLAFTTTPSNFDDLQSEVDALLKTFHWKG